MLTAMLLLAVMVVASACNNNAANNNTKNNLNDGETTPPTNTVTEPTVPEGPEGKYDPPINITTVRQQTPGVEYLPDQTLDDNVWYREFASELGINLTNEWVVSTAQYPNKITVTMVSGDMPDFFEVDMQQFQTLAKAGQLADLTEIFDTYASDYVKSVFDEADGLKMKSGSIDGKLLGLANNGGNRDDAHSLYIREDWLKAVGRTAPKTVEEFIDVAIAFAKEDPDGNGKEDTYGLALAKDIFGGFASIDGLINGHGGFGFNPANGSGTNLIFLKDENGKAIFADTQPEVKATLEVVAQLFAAGAIHPEFSVMDGGKTGETLTASKAGMTFGAFFVPTWPISNMHKENPEVDWGVYQVPSLDGSTATVQSTGVPSRFWVVSKDSAHPEAIMKILNYSTERLSGEKKDVGKYHTIAQNDKNYQIHTITPYYVGTSDKNQDYHYQVVDAVKAGSDSSLDTEAKLYYEQIMKFRAGDTSQWAANKLWSEGGVFATLGKYKKDNLIQMTAYTGAPTPTLISRGPALRDLEVRAFTEIIMGAKPIEHFDEFVKQWHEQGGNDILAEINESGQLQ